MKKVFILFFGTVILSLNSFSQTEEEAIKKVCLAETQAFTDMDYTAWASYHVQSADEQIAWNNPDGSFGSKSGWEPISDGMKEYCKSGQKQNVKLSSDNFAFAIHGDMAFVSFNRSSQTLDGKTTNIREYRTVLRSKGQWKILAVLAYVDHTSGK